MPKCVTCGSELHPERAEKYEYCTAADCQVRNATGLTIVAVGVNKAAEQYQILDERTRQEMASGKHHDQRQATFGPAPAASRAVAEGANTAENTAGPVRRRSQRPGHPAPAPAARPRWSRSQEKLALIYNEQGVRPDEIAQRLRVSTYTVTQIILAAKNRGKL
jgi:hypothetical protein